MKILVTGGAGFIGSAIIAKLQSSQHEIAVVDNLSFGNRSFIRLDDRLFFNVDIRDKSSMKEVLRSTQPDVVIHLAAVHFIPYCNTHPFESSDINIIGTQCLLDVIAETPSVKKIFFASTAAVYPIMNKAIKEDTELQPLDIYGLSKLTGEKLCELFHKKTSIPTIICRFFNAFGPNETNPHLIPEIQHQVNEGKRVIKLGNLDPKRDFIHTTDMANAIELLIGKFDSGIDTFNLGRGIEYSVREVVAAFSKEVGAQIEVETDPSRIRKVERMHLLADISKISRFTGWVPKISLEEGVRTLVNVNCDYV